MAVVVTREGATLTEEEVTESCKIELGSYKQPRRVILQDEPLPRTPVGKIQRKSVRERFWDDAGSRKISGA